MEDGGLSDEAKTMIEKHPGLLTAKCPHVENNDNNGGWIDKDGWEGKTVAECMCATCTACSRDTLVDLIDAGAAITDDCYKAVQSHEDGDTHPDFVCLFLAAGHCPIKFHGGAYFLDWMVDSCADEPVEVLDECLEILLLRDKIVAKPGKRFGFGRLTQSWITNKLVNLPQPKEGVTHAKGGPFAELAKEFLASSRIQGR